MLKIEQHMVSQGYWSVPNIKYIWEYPNTNPKYQLIDFIVQYINTNLPKDIYIEEHIKLNNYLVIMHVKRYGLRVNKPVTMQINQNLLKHLFLKKINAKNIPAYTKIRSSHRYLLFVVLKKTFVA